MKSYKIDNKKLYEQMKEQIEDSWKREIIIKDNKFLETLLVRILKTHPNKEMVILYKNLVDTYDSSNSLLKEKKGIEKKLDNFEKRLKTSISINERISSDESQNSNIFKETNKLRQELKDYDEKIFSKQKIIKNLEIKLKNLEESMYKQSSTPKNVFKANYIEKFENEKEFELRKMHRKINSNNREILNTDPDICITGASVDRSKYKEFKGFEYSPKFYRDSYGP
jgi:hypothetical protein